MKSMSWLVVGVVFACGGLVMAAEWKPASGPLTTRWTKDVSPANALPEYPRPQMVRKEWQNLNGLWEYAIKAKGEERPGAFDGQILVPYPVESALSGVKKAVSEKECLWYRRTFTVPAEWKGRNVLLHFGAVDWEATVFVNGKQVGGHKGGYDAFTLDITEALKAGENEMVVRVWDPTNAGPYAKGKQSSNAIARPGGIFYTPTTGIWQTVWMEPVAAAYITSLKIVPDVDGGKVSVTVNCQGASAGTRVQVNVEDPSTRKRDGDATATEVVIGLTGKPNEAIDLPIRNPKLWSPDHPFLYDLNVIVSEADKPISDSITSYFGMRKISLGKDEKGITRILLNNKFVFQMGFLDQGFWPDGLYTAPTDAALKWDVETTKKLGMNMARKHVKVEPDRWYYWCDKLGLLVWQDMPSGGQGGKNAEAAKNAEATGQFEAELKGMIDGRYNHPCIVMWVVFNEGWGQYDTPRLTKWTKDYDPSRLVNNASGWTDCKCGDVHDMHKYPAPGSPMPEETRAAVLGEYGGLGLAVPGHTWVEKTWGYQTEVDGAALTRRYIKLAKQAYKLKDDPGLCAAVYTQTTDVETECNGLLTYDREVLKVDVEKVAAANRGQFPPADEVIPLVPTSEEKAAEWHYTTEKPAENWMKPGFDDSAWKKGPAGFGNGTPPGAKIRTEWKTADIWIRREFVLTEPLPTMPVLLVHHDEDVEIYINGELAAKAKDFLTAYDQLDVTPKGHAAMKPGKNVMAVHCHNVAGGQYIDVGLAEVRPATAGNPQP